jgi:hypothetical protein
LAKYVIEVGITSLILIKDDVMMMMFAAMKGDRTLLWNDNRNISNVLYRTQLTYLALSNFQTISLESYYFSLSPSSSPISFLSKRKDKKLAVEAHSSFRTVT